MVMAEDISIINTKYEFGRFFLFPFSLHDYLAGIGRNNNLVFYKNFQT